MHADQNEDTLTYWIHYTLLEMRDRSNTDYTARGLKGGHIHIQNTLHAAPNKDTFTYW